MRSGVAKTVRISEFDLGRVVQRFPKGHALETYGGRSSIVLGKRGCGKTVIVLNILAQYARPPGILLGSCIAPSDKFNKDYCKHVPHKFIHFGYSPEFTEAFVKRQIAFKQQAVDVDPTRTLVDTRTFLIMDDVMQYVKQWSGDVNMKYIMSAGRHIDINIIITSQDPLGGIAPTIRTNIDYIFVCKEPKVNNRKKLLAHWCGVFDNQKQFDHILKYVTGEVGRCLVIDNRSNSYELDDSVFWFKSKLNIPMFKLCAAKFWIDNDAVDEEAAEHKQDGEVLEFQE
jgi:hypothetical protein